MTFHIVKYPQNLIGRKLQFKQRNCHQFGLPGWWYKLPSTWRQSGQNPRYNSCWILKGGVEQNHERLQRQHVQEECALLVDNAGMLVSFLVDHNFQDMPPRRFLTIQ